MSRKDSYNAKNITLLEGIDAIRKRPGMYAGEKPYLRMFQEVIDNCRDEFIAHPFVKFDKAHIEVNFDSIEKICSIRDYGRGIPIDIHQSGKNALELILTTLHSGGKFDDSVYKFSTGLHGVGLAVVNALSIFLEVKVHRGGKLYFMRFEKGKVMEELKVLGTTKFSGTEITFKPDTSIVFDALDREILEKTMKDMCYLNPGLSIYFKYDDIETKYESNDGPINFIKELDPVVPIIVLSNENTYVAFSWAERNSKAFCFTNGTPQEDGGTHLSGFKSGITRSINFYIEEIAKKYKDMGITSEDIHKSIISVISCNLKDPNFSSQAKTKLVSPEARNLVESLVYNGFRKYLEENPKIAKEILEHIESFAKQRIHNEQSQLIFKENSKSISRLPGKLIDCTEKNGTLFLVEGDSAGGSAAGTRDRKIHAILPLKGKLINVLRSAHQKVFKNTEIVSLISAIGCGIGDRFDKNKLRYNKIVILTDADDDGSHIRCLLITFFVVFMPGLIKAGHLYVGQAPLYKLQKKHGKKEITYIYSDIELKKYLYSHLLEKYKIRDASGTQMDVDSLIILYNNCSELHAKIKKKHITEEKLASVCSLRIDDLSSYLRHVFDGSVDYVYSENQVNVKYQTIYGGGQLSIGLCKSITEKWPIYVGDRVVYDPISFYKLIDDLSVEGTICSRYKGLGEMNKEELGATVIHNPASLINLNFIEELDDKHANGSNETTIEDLEETFRQNIEIVSQFVERTMGNKESRKGILGEHYAFDSSLETGE